MDGELREQDARAVERHVAGCTACQEIVAAFEALAHELEAEVEPDPGFLVRFRQRRDEVSVAPWWTWRQLALRLVPVAAAVVASAIAALSLSGPSERSLQQIERDALGAPIVVDSGPETVLRIAFEPFPVDIE
jgi:anti-sigma factor RsiW